MMLKRMMTAGIIIAAGSFVSVNAMAASYGCKDDKGKLYISNVPCENELLKKNKRKGLSTEEFNHIYKVQTSLTDISKKRRKAYINETGDYGVEGCFSTSSKLHEQGSAVTYRGYRFLCLKHHKGTIARYNLYSEDMLKQCRVSSANRFCKNLTESSKQELLSQL